MTESLFNQITTIALAIVGLAILAVLVSKNANTSGVIGAAAGGLAQDIGAAVSPVTGGGSYTGFTGFGGSAQLGF